MRKRKDECVYEAQSLRGGQIFLEGNGPKTYQEASSLAVLVQIEIYATIL